MLENALALTEEYAMLPPGGAVLCAVSGGADSVCLLHWLLRRREEVGFSLTAAHFDHMIRGEESARDAAFVEGLCREWGVPLALGRGDVPAEARRRGEGLEEAGRRLRYAFLRRTAAELGGAVIATAHNADDDVETFFLHLLRGAGLQGLTGIPPRRGDLVRPLLTTSRREILSYLEAHGLPHVEDSTNADPSYARNRLRLQLLPLLRELDPRLEEHMGETMARLRGDNDCLNARALSALRRAASTGEGLSLPAADLAGQPDPIALRAAARLLGRMGEHQFRSAHLRALVDLARSPRPSGRVDLPHGLTAERAYGALLLFRGEGGPLPPFAPVPLALRGETEVPDAGWTFSCRPAPAPEEPPSGPDLFYLDPGRLSGPLTVRPRQEGDALAPPGRRRRTVKKWLIDGKVPRRFRERIPLLADGAGPVWMAGLGPESARLAAPGAPALEIHARWKGV